MKAEKYQVIGSSAQWAMVDFGLSLAKAEKALKPAKFSNGIPALCWLWGFSKRAEAEMFASRCREALAFKSGRLGRWIIPTFVVVESARMNR